MLMSRSHFIFSRDFVLKHLNSPLLCASVLHAICVFTQIHSNIKFLQVSGLATRQIFMHKVMFSANRY